MSAAALLQELRDSLPPNHRELPGIIRAIEVVKHEEDPMLSVAKRLYEAATTALFAIRYPDDRERQHLAQSRLKRAIAYAEYMGLS